MNDIPIVDRAGGVVPLPPRDHPQGTPDRGGSRRKPPGAPVPPRADEALPTPVDGPAAPYATFGKIIDTFAS